MRIALIGQAAFAEKALDVLVEHGDEIVHVFAPPDPPSGRSDPLKEKAAKLGFPVSQPKTFKTDEAAGQFKSLNADLAVLANVSLIVPERVLFAPRFQSICFHPSMLPRHRGASAINWTVIQGDAETAITWFWPDKGIDTGPILVQRHVPVGVDDTTGALYFNKLFPLGIEALIECVELIKSGDAPRIAQDESRATYEPPCGDEHAKIDFAKSASEIYNLVRGCDPQPGAYARLGDKRVRLYDPRCNSSASDAPAGTIVAVDADGMRVALRDATLSLKRVRIDPDTKKSPPAELVAAGSLRVGVRLA
ncbi:MAG: methionyl-tRNA formyltransferase [Candidatus Binataceae bacterium]